MREAADREVEFDAPAPPPLRHLSSTATCLESLHDPLATPGTVHSKTIAQFADRALVHDDDKTWSSEMAAHVYCRVRTLTPVLALAPTSVIGKRREAVKKLVGYVWERVDSANPEKQGVAEAPQSNLVEDRQEYPPNAFHTYWAIRMLEEWRRHEPALGGVPVEIQGKRVVAELGPARCSQRRPS